ncbi:MAG: hypothetical protein OXM56_15290 [Gammaproteobacteria bacterium]|nr:hypothetical protein [Gammaproteobacteria bacterium]
MWVLELNDAEITLSRDGTVAYQEPGIASLAGRTPTFGNDALATARLDPRRSENQYFARMNGEPVHATAPGVANQADLVYRHLRQIAQGADLDGAAVHLVVPSTSTPDQLGLLLGIAQEAGIAVASLLDAAVAAACTASLPAQARLLDISLHRASVATLACESTVRRVAAEEVAEAGLLRLLEGWVDAVADRFVAETRFDPLTIAAAEQQVFDQVYAAIAKAGNGAPAELTVEVAHQGDTRTVDLPLSALAGKSAQRYEVLSQHIGAPTTLALTRRAQRLPGLDALLAGLGHTVVRLDAGASRAGVEASADTLEAGDGVSFVSAVAARHHVAPAAVAEAAGTHLLCGAVAVPLRDGLEAAEHPEARDLGAAFRIVRRDAGHHVVPVSDVPVSLNGQPIVGETSVAAGAVIETRGRAFRIVRVIER